MSLIRFTLVAVSPPSYPRHENKVAVVTPLSNIWLNAWGVNTVRPYDSGGTPATTIRMDDDHTFEVAEGAEFVVDQINNVLNKGDRDG